MSYMHPSPRFGPSETPPLIRTLLLLFSCVSIGAAVVSHLFGHWLGYASPAQVLALSTSGLKHWFAWQLLSYVFVVPAPLSFFFLVYLGLALYLIWAMGTALLKRVGSGPFLRLIIIATLSGGLAGLALLCLAPPFTLLAGAMPLCFAILCGWAILFPDKEILLFFAFPVRAKWIVAGFLGLNALLDIGSGNFPSLAADAGAALATYLYALLAWNVTSPFKALQPIDEWICRLGTRLRKLLYAIRRPRGSAHDSSRILRQQQSLDIILEKIAKEGMGSLSWSEKRMLRRAKARKS